MTQTTLHKISSHMTLEVEGRDVSYQNDFLGDEKMGDLPGLIY